MKAHKNIKKKKALICLAAGKSQLSLLKMAKSLGYVIVVIDKDRHAVGFYYADVPVYKSTYDSEEIIKSLLALSDKYKWVGILNRSSGPPVRVAAQLSEYFNIPGVPVDVATAFVNKDQLRVICTKHDIPTPSYVIKNITDDINVDCMAFPVVIKPALSIIGKSGVSVVYSYDEFEKALGYAKENTTNNKILIEEYLPGPDVTLVSFLLDGKLCPICFLDELNIELADGKVASRGYMIHPSSQNDKLELCAHQIVQKIADTFSINRSPFMASFRVDSLGVLKLIEVHLDLGGDLLIEEVFPRALPYDFEELAVKMCAGETACPNTTHIKPTAIFYDKGKGLINERGFQIITADTHHLLNERILEAGM